ncbi:hypothetical protein E0Z10_g8023 [Xylaria hypoxylon]|uniref:Ubiquitin 3 binding protein But2 C-terminal domain-containing protein n=1 Tax=Xylaria hypoxylon TaxID=37992 RepID=A0A4Z0YKT3_9PEZI|nr:hypothetical protein E0Z10_g8023 [Xylaria hypoxylon]
MPNSFLRLVLFAGFVAKHVAAQDQLMSFDVFSSSDCGTDKGMIFTERHNLLRTVQSTPETENCEAGTIDWGSWPQTNGQYPSFVDTSNIEDHCQLIFYTAAPTDDDGTDSSKCFLPYRSLNSNSGCASVSIPKKHGIVYCCGDGCTPILPSTQKRDGNEAELVPTLPRLNGVYNKKRDSQCTFDRTSDITTQYLFPIRSSDVENCYPGSNFDCQVTGEYSTSASISQSNTQGVSVSASTGFLGIGVSFGYETSVTKEIGSSTSFSQTYTLSIPPGSDGYLLFTAKQLCGKGTFNGDGCDNALKVGEQEWCIPALITGQNGTQPDGIWSILETN